MGHTWTFASLERPGFAYRLHASFDDLWDRAYRTNGRLWDKLGEFETYGDGLTQHGYETMVMAANAPDALASLATFLLTVPNDEAERLVHLWPTPPHEEEIDFALAVKHLPSKERYYCLSKRQMSTREDRRFDKRWEKVLEGHDGSVLSACSILASDHAWKEALHRWIVMDAVRRRAGDWSVKPSVVFGEGALCVEESVQACASAFEAIRQRYLARRTLECFAGNRERAKALAATEGGDAR